MARTATPFFDRTDAGQRLADALESYRGKPVTVLALPRGGVPVASVIADRLGAPLDILVVRKVGAPGNQEFGLGAVAEGPVRFLDPELIQEWGLRPDDLEPEVRRQMEEVERLARRLRGGRAFPDIQGRAVILVDDGMATGGTVPSGGGSRPPSSPEPGRGRGWRLLPRSDSGPPTARRRGRLSARPAGALRGRGMVPGFPGGFRGRGHSALATTLEPTSGPSRRSLIRPVVPAPPILPGLSASLR